MSLTKGKTSMDTESGVPKVSRVHEGLVLTGHPKFSGDCPDPLSGFDAVAIASGAIRRCFLGSAECCSKTVNQTLFKTKKLVLVQITDGSGV
jgi:hypothetical protein